MALVDSTAMGSDSPSVTPVLHVLHEFTKKLLLPMISPPQGKQKKSQHFEKLLQQ